MSKEEKVLDIEVRFNAIVGGWIEIHLSTEKDHFKLMGSCAFPPFEELFEFLEGISLGRFPSSFDLHEEGPIKRLLAETESDAGKFKFLIGNPGENKNKLSGNIYFQGVFVRKQFIKEFHKKYSEFLLTNYEKRRWRDNVMKINLSTLEEYLASN